MKTTAYIGRFVGPLSGFVMTLHRSDHGVKVGDVLRFGYDETDPASIRPGYVTVRQVDGSCVSADINFRSAVPAACDSDVVFIERDTESLRDLHLRHKAEDDDIGAVEDYLVSCFRRRDWHGVSDAANDLRVLEAQYSQRPKRPRCI
jgi:hypothetical protein